MRRLLVLLIVASFLGIATNLGLTWWIAHQYREFPDEARLGWTSRGEPGWYYREYTMFGSTRYDGVAVSKWMTGGNNTDDYTSFPAWSFFATPPVEPVNPRNRIVEDSRGWPRRSLAVEYRPVVSPQRVASWSIKHGVELEEDPAKIATARGFGRLPPPTPALPMRILWQGTVVNTVLFTGAWLAPLVLLLGLRTVARVGRRKLRLYRRRCPKCAYDLRAGAIDEGCPECGWNREQLEATSDA